MKGKKHKPEQIIQKLREADAMLSAERDDWPGLPGAGDQRADVAPLAESVRRDEVRGSQAAEGTGGGEQAAEEAAGGSGAGQGDPQGGPPGKLLSPARRRRRCVQVQLALPVSERRACEVLDQPRGTQRYVTQEDEEEQRLIARLHELVRERPRYGYRFMVAMLRREGWRVNRKRVYRLWRREGFQVPRKQRKKRRLGSSDGSCVRRRAEHQDHVWTWDFVFDRTTSGRPLKWLSIVDEYTRECLALEVDRGMTAEDVLDVLRDLFVMRGVPKHIRSDNGPEFIAQAIRQLLSSAGVGTLYIEPGSPWENGYAESFHSRLRSELLDAEIFENVREAQCVGGRVAQRLQPLPAAQQFGLPDPRRVRRRVCCFRSGYACAPAAHARTRSITHSPTHTLITPGTKNGGRSGGLNMINKNVESVEVK